MSTSGTGAAGSTIGSLLTSVVLPVVVGGIIGGSALGGLVYSQTQAPSTNPASQEILVYGD